MQIAQVTQIDVGQVTQIDVGQVTQIDVGQVCQIDVGQVTQTDGASIKDVPYKKEIFSPLFPYPFLSTPIPSKKDIP